MRKVCSNELILKKLKYILDNLVFFKEEFSEVIHFAFSWEIETKFILYDVLVLEWMKSEAKENTNLACWYLLIYYIHHTFLIHWEIKLLK